VLGLSLWAILTAFAAGAPLGLAPADPKKPPPRRSTAIHFGLMIVMFAGLWLSILLPSMATRVPPDGNAIFVQDLAFVLPLLAVTARLLWLGRPMGDLLAVPVLVKMATLGLSVLLGTLIAPLYGQPLKPADVAVYAALGAVPLAILPIFLSRLRAALWQIVDRCPTSRGMTAHFPVRQFLRPPARPVLHPAAPGAGGGSRA
jgi:hypothetical protein